MKYYTYIAFLLPISIMILSGVITYLIPGCDVDSGRGASQQCGVLGPFLSAGILGGFMWFMFGLFGLIPVSFIIFLINKFSDNGIEAETKQSPDPFDFLKDDEK